MDEAQIQLEHEFFEVKRHPDLPEDPILASSIKISGALVLRNTLALQRGEACTIQIADADGQVIATGQAEVQHPSFKDMTFEGAIIGTERVHTAKV